MSDNHLILLLSLGAAVAMALLVLAIADIGADGLSRYRQAFTENAHIGLRELFLFLDPHRLFVLHLSFGLMAGLIAWAVSSSLFLGLLGSAISAILPRLTLKFMRRRRLLNLEHQLPDAAMTLSGSLRAGANLTQALAQLAREGQPPLSQEVELTLREQRLGVPLDTCLEGLDRRIASQSMTLAVSAMRIAQETGGGLAEALERASQTLRTKLAVEAKIRTLTAQGKLQGVVIGLLPLVLMAVLDRMEPEVMHLLYTTPTGWMTLAVVAVLELLGVFFVRKIVTIDV